MCIPFRSRESGKVWSWMPQHDSHTWCNQFMIVRLTATGNSFYMLYFLLKWGKGNIKSRLWSIQSCSQFPSDSIFSSHYWFATLAMCVIIGKTVDDTPCTQWGKHQVKYRACRESLWGLHIGGKREQLICWWMSINLFITTKGRSATIKGWRPLPSSSRFSPLVTPALVFLNKMLVPIHVTNVNTTDWF